MPAHIEIADKGPKRRSDRSIIFENR